MRKYIAEMIGTFALVFAGTGAIVIDEVSGGQVTHVGVALTLGLIVMAMIFAVGDVSGAHLNPAVTCGFWLARRMRGREVAPYVVAQVAGAFAASAALRVMFPKSETLGTTLPAAFTTAAGAGVMEAILTAMLMLVILRVACGEKDMGLIAGIAIGGVVGLEAMFAGPMCGASMNPARSLAPAVVSGHTENLWVYLVAPIIGAAAGAGVFVGISGPAKSEINLA